LNEMWTPGKFSAQPASRAERLWMVWCPFGWEILPFIALIVPGPLCEYAIFRAYHVIGLAGLLTWTALLWPLLVAIHRAGRVRIWLSAPVAFMAYVVTALVLAFAAPR
jgi:hypothetical protein